MLQELGEFISFVKAKELMRTFVSVIIFLNSLSCYSEQIEYEIYSVDEGGNEELIAQGARAYELSDLKYKTRSPEQTVYYLELEDGFSVGVVQSAEDKLAGFALQAIHSDGGFSWEWFDYREDNVFDKRQECGEVSIQASGLPGRYMIRRVDFLTDVCLRLNQSEDIDRDTHKIKILEGSALSLLP